MEYPPLERLVMIWRLIREDPDCRACQEEMLQAKKRLEEYTDGLSREEHDKYWELPTCISTFHALVMDLVCREMRFPEEDFPVL